MGAWRGRLLVGPATLFHYLMTLDCVRWMVQG
jgi:hypothetical protein